MTDGLSTLLDLTNRSEFMYGGLIGLIALLVIAFVTPDQKQRLDWGVVFAAAFLLTIGLTVGRRLGLMLGVGTLALGGWLARPPHGSTRVIFGWLLLVAGAVLIVWRGGLPDIGWVTLLAPLLILSGGAALASWSTNLPQEVLGPMVAISAFGIWATVPDTEAARALLGVSLPMALGTVRPIRDTLSYAGAFPLVAIMVWATAVGGEGRPASIVGGWACLGALVILPLYRRSIRSWVESRPLLVVLFHVVLVGVASRVIGLWESVGLAVVAVLALGVAAYFGVRPLSRVQSDSHASPASD
jgi:hypothetical protein